MSDIDELQSELDAANKANAPKKPVESKADMGVGISMAASIFVCAGFGIAVDHWFDTQPWGLIGFLMLGIASGFYSVWKASR